MDPMIRQRCQRVIEWHSAGETLYAAIHRVMGEDIKLELLIGIPFGWDGSSQIRSEDFFTHGARRGWELMQQGVRFESVHP